MSAATDETVNVNVDIESDEQELPANLNDAGKAAIAKERDARKQAAKEARELKAELDALKADKAAADEAKRLADEKAAEEQGQFKELAEQRANDLAAANAAKQTAQEKLDTLIASIKPDVDEAWKALPEEVSEMLHGDAADVLEQKAIHGDTQEADRQAHGNQRGTERSVPARAENTQTEWRRAD
jgi:excinuclease UvrABC ATPase subunit